MKLRDLAHARAGDKGDTSNISVIAYREADYPVLERLVTVERVKDLFSGLVTGDVVRYEMPGIGALNFVMYGALGGGVTRTLALDVHGKCLASAVLELELAIDDTAFDTPRESSG